MRHYTVEFKGKFAEKPSCLKITEKIIYINAENISEAKKKAQEYKTKNITGRVSTHVKFRPKSQYYITKQFGGITPLDL